MAEFLDHGRVTRAACDRCGRPVEVRPLGDTAWSVGCPCGAFDGTLRGLQRVTA